jgi:hypothetical protein
MLVTHGHGQVGCSQGIGMIEAKKYHVDSGLIIGVMPYAAKSVYQNKQKPGVANQLVRKQKSLLKDGQESQPPDK